ncbi:MAG: 4Fe-4S binding protein [Anaerolineales bacterium]|nr:4Fe-4S binding protein [Anaerolineales bacterium]MDW8228088.1 4Fe-4S binding protein [Anaerolineales bacterium]
MTEPMYGKGILKGLGVTLKRFFETYLDDLKWAGKRYYTPEGIAHRASKEGRGVFTVQYPEEKVPVPEEFRFIPFLVYDEGPNGEKIMRCTSCGICSRVCPPQCIWIVRATDPATGRPIPDPAEFYIDADICMNCGLCAEYCPFDAIKMDHDYELASYGRNVLNKERLAKPASYYEAIRPTNAARENAARAAKQAARLGEAKSE